MSFHRYVVQVEVTLEVPNASSEPAVPADQELIDNLRTAMVGKVKAQRQSREYTVKKVKKV